MKLGYRHHHILLFISFVIGIHLSTHPLFGQEKPSDSSWTTKGDIGFNLSQISLSNWAGGGQNSTTIIGLFNYTLTYQKEKVKWENILQLGYGETKVQGTSWRKTDDRLIFISKYSHDSPIEYVNYSATVDFRTQFTVGRDYENPNEVKISNFMAPGYLLKTLGIDYSPVDFFSLKFAPLGARTIFVFDEELSNVGAYGVTPGSTVLFEGGTNLNLFFKKELFENVSLQSRLNVFSPYVTPLSMVVMWESLLVMKVNDFINVTAALDLFYDERIDVARSDGSVGPATQIRNLFAFGLLYKF